MWFHGNLKQYCCKSSVHSYVDVHPLFHISASKMLSKTTRETWTDSKIYRQFKRRVQKRQSIAGTVLLTVSSMQFTLRSETFGWKGFRKTEDKASDQN